MMGESNPSAYGFGLLLQASWSALEGQTSMLKRGKYPIYIESGDSSFGFSVADAETGASLLFHRPNDLEAELQRPGFDPTGAQVKSQRVN